MFDGKFVAADMFHEMFQRVCNVRTEIKLIEILILKCSLVREGSGGGMGKGYGSHCEK